MFTSLQNILQSYLRVTLSPYGVIRTLFTRSLTGQAWFWSCQRPPSSSVTTPGWWEQARHSWVLLGNKNSKLPRENGERKREIRWNSQKRKHGAHLLPVECPNQQQYAVATLTATPASCLHMVCRSTAALTSECQPHEISLCSSLAQEHWPDSSSSLRKCPVSNVFQS